MSCFCGAPAVIRTECPGFRLDGKPLVVHTWYMTVNGEVEEWGYTHEDEPWTGGGNWLDQ